MDVAFQLLIEPPTFPAVGRLDAIGLADAPPGAADANASAAVTARVPRELLEAQFPIPELTINVPKAAAAARSAPHGAHVFAMQVKPLVEQFTSARQNGCVFSYGARNTSKRSTIFGSAADASTGVAFLALRHVLAPGRIPSGTSYSLVCYGIGAAENLTDFIDSQNSEAIIVDSVREGPRPRKLETLWFKSTSTLADVDRVLRQIAVNVEQAFSSSSASPPPQSPSSPSTASSGVGPTTSPAAVQPPAYSTAPLCAYRPDTVVLSLLRFDDADAVEVQVESNSFHLVALGDSDRPILCGLDAEQQSKFEKSQRLLNGLVSVLAAIKGSRLRIPYGKSRLTAMIKRAFNAEKGNPNNERNLPTVCSWIVHVASDEGSIEESLHTLIACRRFLNPMSVGASGGSMIRDMLIDKWRLEQDIVELKDELAIAKIVYDYRPCIFEKNVANIQEEEAKRVQLFQRKRDEAKEKALAEVKLKAQEEAKRQIDELDRQNQRTLKDLERLVKEKRDENAALQQERAKKMKEYERHLEKLRKKKDEEEAALTKLAEEVAALETDVTQRQEAIRLKKQQLEVASRDVEQGRQAIIKDREETKEKRRQLLEQRKQKRAQWLEEIRMANERLLAQIDILTKLREEKLRKEAAATNGSGAAAATTTAAAEDAADGETVESVRQDIDSINQYIPKLISLDDAPADTASAESIRRQLEEYFQNEREEYLRKIESETAKLKKLDAQVQTYKSRVQEFQAKQKREQLAEAMRKETHIQSLADQVVQYLQFGVRLFKVSSTANVRHRFFFLSEDCRRLHSCELDDTKAPVGRKKPTTTIVLKDIKRVSIGLFGPSVRNFIDAASAKVTFQTQVQRALRDDGSGLLEKTSTALSPSNLGTYVYRSFCLELRNGKTLELVCESDSDAEAWIVALKRLFLWRTRYEQGQDRLANRTVASTADIQWGAATDVRGRLGSEQLSATELVLCNEQHIPPLLFIKAKAELSNKAQSSFVTLYDVRVVSNLDMFRAQALYEFFLEHGIVAPPV